MAKKTAATALKDYADLTFDATGPLKLTMSSEAAEIAIPRSCNSCLGAEEAKRIPGVVTGWFTRSRSQLVMTAGAARREDVVSRERLKGLSSHKSIRVRFVNDATMKRIIDAKDDKSTKDMVGECGVLLPVPVSLRLGTRPLSGGSRYPDGKKGAPRGQRARRPQYR